MNNIGKVGVLDSFATEHQYKSFSLMGINVWQRAAKQFNTIVMC
jgi:hypothetical protein